MATSIPTGSPYILTRERAGVTVEAERNTFMTLLAGSSEENAIVSVDREGVERGETVKVRFHPIEDDRDMFGDYATILGNEGGETFLEDQVTLRYFAAPAAIENMVIDQQRIPVNLKRSHLRGLGTRWRIRREKWLINQLAGDTVAAAAGGTWGAVNEYTGGNTVTGVDAGHHLFAKGSSTYTTDAGVAGDATAIMSPALLRKAVTRARSRAYSGQRFAFAPCRTPWGRLYVCVMFNSQWEQLMTYSTTNEFTMIEQAKIQGGMDPSLSTFIQGPGTIFENTLVLTSDLIPQGITSSAYQANSRRAIFFGAQAVHAVHGENFTGGETLGYTEHVVHNRWSAQAFSVCGYKATEVTVSGAAQRWASFVLSTYSEV